jgi:glycosyltransferase involved in cell wall biosynthesis
VNILQSIGWYFPESTGGSEVYLYQLVQALRKSGVTSTIAAPIDLEQGRVDCIDGTDVHRYPVSSARNHAQIVGLQPHGGFSQFAELLSGHHHDVYHQHSWTYGCGLHHLKAAKAAGLPAVLTIHVPGPVCLSGTMLNNGSRVCDGRIDTRRCAECWLLSKGAGPLASRILSRMPVAVGGSLRGLGSAGTALATSAIVDRHLATLLEAAAIADRVVAVCQWLGDALLVNGIDPRKVVVSRQGLGELPELPVRQPHAGPLRVGFLGRTDPVKGAHLLMNAVAALPAACAIELRMHMLWSNQSAWQSYQASLRQLAAGDARIKLLDPLPPDQVRAFLADIDLLAVPSQWLETGPLVVLEAFAAGVPVIGSDLGGIAELVSHGVDGLLLPFDRADQWTDTLLRLASAPDQVRHLANGVDTRVRSMKTVADEMVALYTGLLKA